MSDESRRDAAEDQGQMKDQEAFSDDPRAGEEVSEQQGETGRDDGGQASGNPANAG